MHTHRGHGGGGGLPTLSKHHSIWTCKFYMANPILVKKNLLKICIPSHKNGNHRKGTSAKNPALLK